MNAREDGQFFWDGFARSRTAEGEGDTAALALRGYCPVYDAYRHRSEQRVVRAVLPNIERGWRILDIGCGPGRWTVPLAAAGAHVTAMDFSDAMLAHARARCASAGLAERVDLRRGRLETLDCFDLGGPFELVLAMGVLQYISSAQLGDVVARLARCVKPGGLLLHRETLAPRPFSRDAACAESGTSIVSHYKPFEQYRDAFQGVGLELVARRSILPPSLALALLQRIFPCELNARNALGRALYAGVIGVREILLDPLYQLFPELLWRFNQRRPTDLAAVLYRRADR